MTSSIAASPAISTHKTGISMLPLPVKDRRKTDLFIQEKYNITQNKLSKNKEPKDTSV